MKSNIIIAMDYIEAYFLYRVCTFKTIGKEKIDKKTKRYLNAIQPELSEIVITRRSIFDTWIKQDGKWVKFDFNKLQETIEPLFMSRGFPLKKFSTIEKVYAVFNEKTNVKQNRKCIPYKNHKNTREETGLFTLPYTREELKQAIPSPILLMDDEKYVLRTMLHDLQRFTIDGVYFLVDPSEEFLGFLADVFNTKIFTVDDFNNKLLPFVYRRDRTYKFMHFNYNKCTLPTQSEHHESIMIDMRRYEIGTWNCYNIFHYTNKIGMQLDSKGTWKPIMIQIITRQQFISMQNIRSNCHYYSIYRSEIVHKFKFISHFEFDMSENGKKWLLQWAKHWKEEPLQITCPIWKEIRYAFGPNTKETQE